MSSVSRYIVRRLNWKSPVAGRYVRLPGWTEVAAFDAAETADADRRRREQEVRTVVNPFACVGSFVEMSSLPGPVLADWLMDGGLEPPAGAPFDQWRAWWDAAAGTMTAEERAHAWAGFDKLRFYDAAERPPGQVHAVLNVHWERRYDDWSAPYEGGDPLRAFRSAAAAEVDCRQVGEGIRSSLRVDEERYRFSFVLVGARAQAGHDPFFEHRAGNVEVGDSARFTEAAAVPVAGDLGAVKAGWSVYLVQRLSWSWHVAEGTVHWITQFDRERIDGVPVMAFLSRQEAEAYAWELDYVTRMYLNPFRFGHPDELSSVPEFGFRSVLGDAGLDLPAGDWHMRERWRVEPYPDEGVRGVPAVHLWEDWWAATADGLSAAQREAVWDLLDQLRFYQVRAIELRD
ncbi:MAG TPA: hypothetical protein VM533_20710 [Fimbriiglobus sp.]|jgi:hypothetical protein|nr:hypothetical protein [Fimbriiglobus sp.]